MVEQMEKIKKCRWISECRYMNWIAGNSSLVWTSVMNDKSVEYADVANYFYFVVERERKDEWRLNIQ